LRNEGGRDAKYLIPSTHGTNTYDFEMKKVILQNRVEDGKNATDPGDVQNNNEPSF
jgi:hypothetical protein